MMQYVADGIVNASLIGLGAVGLSMTYNVLRFANFSQGEVLSVGAYFTMLVVTVLGAGIGTMGPIAFGWPLLVSIAFAVALTGAVAVSYTHLTLPTKRIV